MTELEAIDVILQVTQGLACIHEANLIHRDIKPSNLMTTKDGIVKSRFWHCERSQGR